MGKRKRESAQPRSPLTSLLNTITDNLTRFHTSATSPHPSSCGATSRGVLWPPVAALQSSLSVRQQVCHNSANKLPPTPIVETASCHGDRLNEASILPPHLLQMASRGWMHATNNNNRPDEFFFVLCSAVAIQHNK
ncbi:hypothetical protein XENORESO_007659 [Xenotaenia resolanae]|uniref:Uncharacterized protein n=1 Tax=Xenotaenia resolanae TaxID=208358 RepID=A0ABV0WBW9_9TELE